MTDWDNSTDTERQNDDRTTEQPETESSPSIPMFLVDKIRHKKSIHKASEWFLEGTDKGILVIGDSNISRISKGSRAQIQTESFPGAQIGHINTVLNKMIGPQVENYPECVILSVGINDMNNSPGSTTIPAMRKLAQKANKQFPRSRIAIPRINCPAHLSKSQKANIKAINDSLVRLRNISIIPELDQKLFRTIPGDIHWTADTADTLLNHWLCHLN